MEALGKSDKSHFRLYENLKSSLSLCVLEDVELSVPALNSLKQKFSSIDRRLLNSTSTINDLEYQIEFIKNKQKQPVNANMETPTENTDGLKREIGFLGRLYLFLLVRILNVLSVFP